MRLAFFLLLRVILSTVSHCRCVVVVLVVVVVIIVAAQPTNKQTWPMLYYCKTMTMGDGDSNGGY